MTPAAASTFQEAAGTPSSSLDVDVDVVSVSPGSAMVPNPSFQAPRTGACQSPVTGSSRGSRSSP
jgi:hypothetical protein